MRKQLNNKLSFHKFSIINNTLPPESVRVAKMYSASVDPASFLEDMSREYQVPGTKSVIVTVCCSGITLLLTRVHSWWPLILYWRTKNLTGHPPLCQLFRFTVTVVEFTESKSLLSGAMGAIIFQ